MENVKIYNLKQIETACIVGSPIAAGILIAHNFRKWDNDKQAINWIIIGILWTVGILAISLLIPEGTLDRSLTFLPFINGAILYPIIKKYQGNKIDEHFENSGEKVSNWNVTGIIVIIMALIMTPLILIDQNSPINDYVRKDFSGNGIYYNSTMPVEEVEKLGGIMKRIEYFIPENQSEIIFLNNEFEYKLKLIIDKAYFKDVEYINFLQSLINHLNKYKFKKRINLCLIDELLSNEKEIKFNKNLNFEVIYEVDNFIRKPNFRLYYNIDVPAEERMKFQDVILGLDNIFTTQFQTDFVIDIVDSYYKLNLYSPKANWTSQDVLTEATKLKRRLNSSSFSKPFRLVLFDENQYGYEEKEIE